MGDQVDFVKIIADAGEKDNLILVVFIVILLAYFAYRLGRFLLKISPLTKDLELLNDRFPVGKNEPPAKARAKFYDNYANLNRCFSNIHVHSLSHLWWEYRESFVFPDEAEAGMLDKRELVVKNSQSPHNFFNEETIIERHIDLRRLESASTTLTSIGILGTFVGLTVGIAGLSHSLTDFNSANLTEALTLLLKGASLAFITSVVGMSLAITFSCIEKHCLRKTKEQIVKFVDKLERSLLLVTSEHGHRAMLSEMKEHTRLLENFSNELATSIGNDVGRAVGAAFTNPDFYQGIAEAVERNNNVTIAISESLAELTSASEAIVKASVNIDKSTERLENSNHSLSKLFTEFDQSTSNFQQESDAYLRELTDNFTKAVSVLGIKVKGELVDNVERQNENINRQVHEQQKIVKSSNDLQKHLKETNEKLSILIKQNDGGKK